MPLTKTGKKVLRTMTKKHGAKKAKQKLHATIRKGASGSSKLHSYGRGGKKSR